MNDDAGSWSTATAWTAVEETTFLPPSGPEADGFARVVDVAGLADGGVVVLDGANRRVLSFDASGAQEFAVGGPGEGPGEFGVALFDLVVTPDARILVREGDSRLTSFTLEGVLLGTSALTPDVPGTLVKWKRHPDDSIVGRFWTPSSDQLFDYSFDGERVRPVLKFSYTSPEPTHTRDGLGITYLFLPVPLWTPLRSGGFAIANAQGTSVTVTDRDGTPLRRFTYSGWQPSEATEAFEASAREVWAQRQKARGVPEALAAQIPVEVGAPLTMTALMEGPESTLWVQRPAAPAQMRPESLGDLVANGLGSNEWDVFTSDGERLGLVRLPTTLHSAEIVGEMIFGVAEDDMGLQRVVRYRISLQ
ncbi:MAG: hypothetical protein RQ745_05875 [Longimicrobiales bacterium]|nr:hypothetical protein [Longimicrobiales bacterium]